MRNASILLAGPLLAFLFVMTDVWAFHFGRESAPSASSAPAANQFARREAQLRDARELLSQLDTYFAKGADRARDPRDGWTPYLESWPADSFRWALDPNDPGRYEFTGEAPFTTVHELLSALDQETGPWIVDEVSLEPAGSATKVRLLVRVPPGAGGAR